jgi:hypothetical protein
MPDRLTDAAGAAPLCPSTTAAPGVEGVRLTGVVGRDGRVANLLTPLPVDAAFLAEANRHGVPEKRFRFSAPCVEGRCGNWAADAPGGGACGLIGRIRQHVAAHDPQAIAEPTGLQACAIRARCRWWLQDGAAACAVCTLVTYNAADAGPAARAE